MILFLEIILTIIAWVRGWKWRALIPLISLLVIGFMAGTFLLSLGIDPEAFIPAGIFLDFLGIIALVIMIAVKPKTLPKPDKPIKKTVER